LNAISHAMVTKHVLTCGLKMHLSIDASLTMHYNHVMHSNASTSMHGIIMENKTLLNNDIESINA
jgi:hypothetical protein